MFMRVAQQIHHPRAGGGPARGVCRAYKGRLTAADQTPAFAGVVIEEGRVS
jgi:hypothetical protein